MKIMVETSARHIHLTQEDLDTLFGKDYQLTPKKDLSQPGQFACAEKVEVVGPKSSLKLSILGPVRPETQVELAKTDARTLGIDAPLRMSGCLEGTPGCKLIGPKGEVTIDHGVIVAKRHAHFTPEQAVEYGVTDGESIGINSTMASGLLSSVMWLPVSAARLVWLCILIPMRPTLPVCPARWTVRLSNSDFRTQRISEAPDRRRFLRRSGAFSCRE